MPTVRNFCMQPEDKIALIKRTDRPLSPAAIINSIANVRDAQLPSHNAAPHPDTVSGSSQSIGDKGP